MLKATNNERLPHITLSLRGAATSVPQITFLPPDGMKSFDCP